MIIFMEMMNLLSNSINFINLLLSEYCIEIFQYSLVSLNEDCIEIFQYILVLYVLTYIFDQTENLFILSISTHAHF